MNITEYNKRSDLVHLGLETSHQGTTWNTVNELFYRYQSQGIVRGIENCAWATVRELEMEREFSKSFMTRAYDCHMGMYVLIKDELVRVKDALKDWKEEHGYTDPMRLGPNYCVGVDGACTYTVNEETLSQGYFFVLRGLMASNGEYVKFGPSAIE